jgi:glycosyltransferase involved in cell wall biosynthesis
MTLEHPAALAPRVEGGAKRRYMLLLRFAPWLLNGGGLIRNYWMALALARQYDLDLIIGEAPPTPPPPDFAAACTSITYFPKAERTLLELYRVLGALDPNGSYLTSGQVTAEQRDHIAKMVAQHRYAAIQVGDINQFGALPSKDCPPLWYDAHNSQYDLMRRQADFEPFPLNLAVKLDAWRVKRIEKWLVDHSLWVTTCTDQDLIDLTTFCPAMKGKSTMIPSGVDVAKHADVRAAAPQAGCILLSGSFSWRPTLQGLMWFVDEVLPHLPESVDGIPLEIRLAGRMLPSLVAALSKHPRLALAPNPVDMRPELARAQIIAVPVLASSGVRVRIYEAWAAGRPVVTTPSGALGLAYRDGDELVARTGPKEFADALVSLVRDQKLWEHVRQKALERVTDFDWPAICDRIVELHRRVIPA